MKKRNSKLFTPLLGVCALSLSSCMVVKPIKFRILAQDGAPIFSVLSYIKDEDKLINFADVQEGKVGTGTLKYIGDAFFDDNASGMQYDAVIYDVHDGLELIQKYNLPFKLARVLNVGNLCLLNTKHNSIADDEIDGNTTERVIRKLTNTSKVAYYSDMSTLDVENDFVPSTYHYITKAYPEIDEDNLVRIDTLKDAIDLLYNRKQLDSYGVYFDYVFIENPFAYQAIRDNVVSYQEKGVTKYFNPVDYYYDGQPYSDNDFVAGINFSLQMQMYYQTSIIGDEHLQYYPDKGLFIRDTLDAKSNEKMMKNFFKAVDYNCTNMINFNSYLQDTLFNYGNDEKQKDRLGTDVNEMTAIQRTFKLPYYPYNKHINIMNFVSPKSSTYNIMVPKLYKFFESFVDLHNPLESSKDKTLMSKYFVFPK